MSIAIIKYNAGNIQSVLYALERIGMTATVTDDPEQIKAAEKVIFPGVGEASSAMAYLRKRKLDILLKSLQQPVLGICLGMQLMCAHTEEGDTDCLGIFDNRVRKFNQGLKVPQIGWNRVSALKGPLMKEVAEGSYCYFVHSYHASLGEHTIAQTDYGIRFSSGLQKDNFFGVQFHPEKSAETGERILRNFLNS